MPLYTPVNLSAFNGNIIPDGNATRTLGAANFDWSSLRVRTILSSVADGASAVGVILDTGAAFTTSGAKLVSMRTNGTEVIGVTKDGRLLAGSSISVGFNSNSTNGRISTDDSTGSVFGYSGNTITTDGTRHLVAGPFRFGALEQNKVHASFTGSEHNTSTGAVQTTNATPAQAFTLTLADNTLYWAEAMIIGRDAAGTERAFYARATRAHRQAAGSATLGTVASLATDESNASLDATFTVSGNDLRVTVTGLAGVTINWAVTVRFQGVSLNT